MTFRKKNMRVFAGKMKAAIIAFGHSDNVICLLRSLSKSIDVTLIMVTAGERFTRSLFDWDLSQLPYGLTTDVNRVREFIGEGIIDYIGPDVKVCLARTPSRKVLRDWKRKNLTYVKEIAQYVHSHSFDVVHFNGFSGFQLFFHFLLRRIPKVCTIHDYLPHSGEWKITPVVFNRLYSKLDYQFIQHYKFLANAFTEYYDIRPNKVHTVYCGPLDVYRSFMNGSRNEEPMTILFFGRISKYKGIDYLVQAAPIIKARVPDAKIIIAGKGDFNLESIDTRIFEIHNYHIPNDELVNLIQRASIVVAPYTDATHSAVIMTAFAFNKPVVASAVGGIPEVVEDGITGKLVPPRDAESLGNAIIELLLDSEKREIMRHNIAERSLNGKISWNNIAKETIGVYTKAIKSFRV